MCPETWSDPSEVGNPWAIEEQHGFTGHKRENQQAGPLEHLEKKMKLFHHWAFQSDQNDFWISRQWKYCYKNTCFCYLLTFHLHPHPCHTHTHTFFPPISNHPAEDGLRAQPSPCFLLREAHSPSDDPCWNRQPNP